MPTHHLTEMEAIEQFRQFMQDNGISPPSSIEADGEIHRYHIEGQKSGSKNGAYAFYYNGHGFYGGWVRDWTLGEQTFNWSSHSKSDFLQLSPKQRESIRKEQQRQREQSAQEIKNQYQHGINNAVWVWEQAQACHSHPYLENKRLSPMGLRVLDNPITINTYSEGEKTYIKDSLIIPINNSEGYLISLQVISRSYLGSPKPFFKQNLKDAPVKAGRLELRNDTDPTIIDISEGYATSLSVHLASEQWVVVAFSLGNLELLAKEYQTNYPNALIRLACDNDQFKDNNAGMDKGKEISQKWGIPYTYPEFLAQDWDKKPKDFNDSHGLYGLEEVKKQLAGNQSTVESTESQELVLKQVRQRIAELAQMDSVEYGRIKTQEAEKLGLGVRDLNQAIKEAKKTKPNQAKKSVPLDQYPLIYTDDEGKEKLLAHNKASRVLRDQIQTLAFDPVSEDWFAYQKTGIWKMITKTEQWTGVEKHIYKLGGQVIGCQSHYIDGVNTVLKGLLIKRFDQLAPKHLLPFKNGVLDLNTQRLLSHDPSYSFTWQLPYDYQQSSDCQPFQDYLRQCIANEDQMLIIAAYINAVIKGRADLQKYLELIGFGGSGKSVLIAVLVALVGSKNSHSTTLKILAKDKFEIANIYQKRLVIITDAEKWSGDIAQFKAITGQDHVRYEVKFEQAKGNFVYQGMVVLASNHHLSTNDNSSGIQRRRITILFDHVVSPDQCDPNLAKKLSEYTPQIINWALALSDKQVTNVLLNPVDFAPSLAEQEQETIQATNPIAGWAMDNLEPEPDQKVQIGTLKQYSKREGGGGLDTTEHFYHHEEDWLYPNFAQWFNQNNHNDRYSKRISIKEFKRSVIDILRNVLKWGDIKEVTINGCRHIKGISIKETETEQSTNKPTGYLSRIK